MEELKAKYFGVNCLVQKRSFLPDTGVVFLCKNTLYVSPQYYDRLINNFNQAILEQTRLIKLDDPLDTIKYADVLIGFTFLTNEIMSRPGGKITDDIDKAATKFAEVLMERDRGVPVYYGPYGNYSNSFY